MCDFKSFSSQGQVVEARWKTLSEWPIFGWWLSVLSLITFFLVVAVVPLWIGMCWHGPLIPKVHTLCLLAIRSCSLNNMWEGKSSGGRESGINSLGQSVIALLGRWPGIDA